MLQGFANWILESVIGFERVDNLQVFADLYNESNNILDWNLVKEYLASQPSLLCACILFAFIVLASVAALGAFCICYALGTCSAKRYLVTHNYPPSIRWFIALLLTFLGLWILMGICSLSMILAASTLGSRFSSELEHPQINHNFNGSETDRHVVINLDSVLIDENAPESTETNETLQLLRFKDIRELGYEFKPLETDTIFSWQAVILWLLAAIYSFGTFTIGILVALGSYPYLLNYHPSNRSSISNYTGQWVIHSSVALFVISPIAFFTSGIFLIYTHIYEMICPLIQTLTQNHNMENYINMHFSSFDSYNLGPFLNDLLVERMENNDSICHTFIMPVEKLWAGAFIAALLSIPFVTVLLLLSKYFLKLDTKYYWSQHETYSTIPDSKKVKHLPIVEPVFCPKY
uniref:Uncharacterized protein n=1 Tax=Panagrolaimus sp. PS1159 TaxID=55785 RepID=A0AC35EVR9_9BILA